MTALVPMQPEAFAAFLEIASAGYAADNVASGRWLDHEALQLARAESEALLPNGVATPDNYLFEILADPGGPSVGFLWFAALARGSRRVAYLYQLEVHPPFRRCGHGLAALALLESIASDLGLSAVAPVQGQVQCLGRKEPLPMAAGRCCLRALVWRMDASDPRSLGMEQPH